MCTAEPLDGKRIHIPPLLQPRSRDFSPVEVDGVVVDPYGWSREVGRVLNEHSESTCTFYFARKLRPGVFFEVGEGYMLARFHCILY